MRRKSNVEIVQEQMDRQLANFGDLDAIERNARRKRIDRLEREEENAASLPLQPAPKYSEEALKRWFDLRVVGWPNAMPIPTGPEDRVAAENYFQISIGLTEFRRIRQTTPLSWRRKGPRRPISD